MDFSNYQHLVSKYDNVHQKVRDIPFGGQIQIMVWALSLASESGEVADLIKDQYTVDQALDMLRVEEEIGDVLLSASLLCTSLDIDMQKVAIASVNKLDKKFGHVHWRVLIRMAETKLQRVRHSLQLFLSTDPQAV